MPVTFTNPLSPETQAVADAREAVRKAAYHVEECKTELKTAKAIWEEAVQRQNDAIDAMIEAERQPTLFSRFNDDPPTPTPAATPDDRNPEPDPPAPPAPETPAAGENDGGTGSILDAEYEVNPDAVPPRPATTWRATTIDAAFGGELHENVVAKIRPAGTCGELADRILDGETYGLTLIEMHDVCESVELMSADDETPLKFGEDGELPEADAVAGEPDPDTRLTRLLSDDPTHDSGNAPTRDQYPDDKTGSWAFKLAVTRHFGNASEEDERIDGQIAGYRERQASGTAQSAWGKWSELDVSITTPDGEHTVRVLYKPDWRGDPTRDHIEAWGPLSPTNYFSDEITNLKGKRPKLPLVEWCREWSQQQADNFAKEQKKRRGKAKGQPAKKGA